MEQVSRVHQLIGTEVSLYTGKARAYLQYKNVPFEEVLSTGDVYRNVIIPRTGVRYIPVVITADDQALQDTTAIIDAFEARYRDRPVYPQGPLQRLLALLLEVYGDEWLVIPAMHYRWNVPENRAFAFAEFGRTSAPELAPDEQRQLGEKLAGPFAGALPYLGITEESASAIEQSYFGFLSEFDAHLAHHPYLLGGRPSIGDFGFYGPLYAHLYRDPAAGELMRARAPRVASWVERMREPQLHPSGGGFLPDDRIPETLRPLIARIFREQIPVLHGTVDRLAAWASEGQETVLPRSIGWQPFALEGITGQKSVSPYQLWMWQRPHDHYASLSESGRAQVDAWLANIPGAAQALARSIPQRVARRDNRIVLA